MKKAGCGCFFVLLRNIFVITALPAVSVLGKADERLSLVKLSVFQDV